MEKLTEEQHQILFIQWIKRNTDLRVFAIPNGGYKISKRMGARLKAQGLHPGVPDIYLPSLRLWIEFKALSGRLSAMQKDWLEYLESIGDKTLVSYGHLPAIEKVKELLDND